MGAVDNIMLKDKQNELSVKEFADQFFANPWNRFIMNMFAVHDGEMTIKEAIGKQKVNPVK